MTEHANTEYPRLTDDRQWHRYSYNIGSPYDDWATARKDAQRELEALPLGAAIVDVHWAGGDGYLVVRPTVEDAERYLDELVDRHRGTRPSRHYADLTYPGCSESSAVVLVVKAAIDSVRRNAVTDDDLRKLQQEAEAAHDFDTVYLVNCALDLPGPAPKMPPGDARAKLEQHIMDVRKARMDEARSKLSDVVCELWNS
jgi:hypothetical protein